MKADKAQRDPRKNPKVGDVLSSKGLQRQVSEVVCEATGDIRIIWARSMSKWGSTYLYAWRKWARDAEVLHVAD